MLSQCTAAGGSGPGEETQVTARSHIWAKGKEMLHICIKPALQEVGQPCKVLRAGFALVSVAAASSLVLPEPVDACGWLPGTWVARPQGHAQTPLAASSRA